MPDVIEINDIEELGDYSLLWDSLLLETPRASFFHTYDWLRTYWNHFGQGKKLRALVVRSADKPIGIVPFCVRRRPHALGHVRVLTYPLEDWGTVYGPIGKNQAATLMIAMKHLTQTHRNWEEIDLPWINDNGRTKRALELAGFTPRCEPYQTSSLIDMAGNWEDYLARLDSKVRHEMRRNLRRVNEFGKVEFVRHRPAPQREGDGDPRWDLYDQCEQVAQASWQARSTSGNTLCHNKFREFYRDAHAAAAKLGRVDLATMKLDDRPVAFSYNYHYEGSVFGLRIGYDASVPYQGFGKALLSHVIRDGFERGDRCLELGMGDEKFKQQIRTDVLASRRLNYTPLTAWRPQIVRASRWLRRLAVG